MSQTSTTVPKLRRALKRSSPGLRIEKEFWDQGHSLVVGLDEVGKGSWAGPLTVGAAVVPKSPRLYKIRDSKQLTEPEREAMFARVADWCHAWSVGHASPQECDELGMSEAQRLAARRAMKDLGCEPDAVILDGKWDFVGHPVTEKLVKADSVSLSVAAASILAKVTRDRLMRVEAENFPSFNFENNKGYPCPKQRLALSERGPTTIHRQSWAFMDDLPWPRLKRPNRNSEQIELF